MKRQTTSSLIPGYVWGLVALYCIASLLHFSHNAEYIAFYPDLPLWLTREKVYLAWFAVSSVGLVGVALAATGWPITAAVFFVAYGLSGLDGLGHYTLALCSEHTIATNLTIAFEALAGVALAISAFRFVGHRARSWLRHSGA